jgi:hypothetical protein
MASMACVLRVFHPCLSWTSRLAILGRSQQSAVPRLHLQPCCDLRVIWKHPYHLKARHSLVHPDTRFACGNEGHTNNVVLHKHPTAELGTGWFFLQQLHMGGLRILYGGLHLQRQPLQVDATASQGLARLLCPVPPGPGLCSVDIGNCTVAKQQSVAMLVMASGGR